MPEEKSPPAEFNEIPVQSTKGPTKEYAQFIKLADKAFKKGNAEETILNLKKAFEIYTENAEDWVMFGIVHEYMKQPEQAFNAYKRAIFVDPMNQLAWLNLARNFLIAGQIEEAIKANKKVLEFDPKNAVALMNLGTCYDQKGDTTAAIEAYKKSVHFDAKLSDAWFNYAKICEKIQDYPNAIKNYRQVLRLNPKDEAAKNGLHTARLALKTASKTEAPAQGQEPKLKTSIPIGPRFYDIVDMREKLKHAMVGAFFSILAFYIVTFLVSCIGNTIYATRTDAYSQYSNGSPLNEVLALWAVAFTPFTQLNYIQPDWMSSAQSFLGLISIPYWLFYLLPAVIAGIILANSGNGIKYTIVSGVFFIFWGFILPLVYVIFLPLISSVSPMSFNAALASSFQTTLHLDPFTNFFMDMSSIYLGWSFSGAIQIGGFSLLIAIPFALLSELLQKRSRSKKSKLK